LRIKVDDFLLKMNETIREQVKANKEDFRVWFSELLKNMELVDLRRNPQRHLPAPSEHMPEPCIFSTSVSNTRFFRLKLVLFELRIILSDPRPQDFVSVSEFNNFSEDIRTQLAS